MESQTPEMIPTQHLQRLWIKLPICENERMKGKLMLRDRIRRTAHLHAKRYAQTFAHLADQFEIDLGHVADDGANFEKIGQREYVWNTVSELRTLVHWMEALAGNLDDANKPAELGGVGDDTLVNPPDVGGDTPSNLNLN